MNGYVIIEGQGEVAAVTNLLTRLASDLKLPPIHWRPPMRKAVTSQRVALEVCEIVRSKADIDCLLVLRDEDDGCPRQTGPELAGWLAAASLPFPTAATLMYREYEVLFTDHGARAAAMCRGKLRSVATHARQPAATYDGIHSRS